MNSNELKLREREIIPTSDVLMQTLGERRI